MSALPGLVGRMAQRCVRLALSEREDAHGGTVREWAEGEAFEAAVSSTGPTNALALATRPDSSATCVLTAPLGTGLAFHDRVRTADGRTLLVTSEAKDRHTPGPASFAFERYECEEAADG